MKKPKLETVKNRNQNRDYNIHIEFPEFTCVCPRTGLPDFANIVIDYIPNKKIVELKSLKLYFVSFRNHGTFHEDVINKILDELVAALQPRAMTITGQFGVRGGIETTVSVGYPQ